MLCNNNTGCYHNGPIPAQVTTTAVLRTVMTNMCFHVCTWAIRSFGPCCDNLHHSTTKTQLSLFSLSEFLFHSQIQNTHAKCRHNAHKHILQVCRSTYAQEHTLKTSLLTVTGKLHNECLCYLVTLLYFECFWLPKKENAYTRVGTQSQRYSIYICTNLVYNKHDIW